MSPYLWLQHEYSYNPADHTVNVPIRVLVPSRPPLTVIALLDTGAATSCFDRALCPVLGISDIGQGQPIPIRLANNDQRTGYVHQVEIEFLGHRMTIPVVFSPDFPEGTDNLLGMEGFFDQVTVAFQHRNRKIFATI